MKLKLPFTYQVEEGVIRVEQHPEYPDSLLVTLPWEADLSVSAPDKSLYEEVAAGRPVGDVCDEGHNCAICLPYVLLGKVKPVPEAMSKRLRYVGNVPHKTPVE